jgi:hypothetical protein
MRCCTGDDPLRPALPTEFELQVRHLRLTPEDYASSPELRAWCMKRITLSGSINLIINLN